VGLACCTGADGMGISENVVPEELDEV
jgi:hypothetical protein